VFPAALVVVLLLCNNVVVPRVPDIPGAYVEVNAAAAVALLGTARATGLSWAELGLSRSALPAGLRWGGAAAGLVAAGCAVALAVPALRPLVTDARVAGMDGGQLVTQVLVTVPLGTVLWEEVAFRGVLLAALTRVLPVRRAVQVAAGVFGIWHVRPTLSGLAANDLAEGSWARAGVVVLVCAATAVAGLVFSWLRLRSGSLLAPALLHLATNALGSVTAAAAGALG
jgi:membrane protease YdiL (CAAX protease family)